MPLNFPWKLDPKPQAHTFASSSLASFALSADSTLAIPKVGMQWQAKAWEYYDVVPEMRLVVDYRASALSKALLQIREHVPDSSQLVDSAESERVRSGLFGGVDHHSSSLHRITEHLTVVGETYVVIVAPDEGAGEDALDEWLILPPDAVDVSQARGSSGYVKITDLRGVERRLPLQGGRHNIIRLWEPHPHNYWEANGPTRGAIATLDKIAHLDANIKTSAMSRLIGNGMFFMPLEAQLPQPSVGDVAVDEYDKFRRDLHRKAGEGISNPGSPLARMPHIVHMPAEAIKAIREPVNFYTDFDKEVATLRDNEIRRYASGQPLPTEMVVGLGTVNHWSSWQLTEHDLKFDIAPLGQLICGALTSRIVVPLLGDNFFLEPDFGELTARPDRTPEAIQLYAAGIATQAEAREMAGLPEIITDNPDGDSVSDGFKPEPGKPRLLKGNIVGEKGSRPDPPRRRSTPSANKPTVVGFSADSLPDIPVRRLVADDLLRETGKRMLSDCPRSARAEMMRVVDRSRYAEFDGAVAAFSAVRERVLARYVEFAGIDRIAEAVEFAVVNRVPLDVEGSLWP